ncbi:MAG: hypothetical protein ACTHJL_09055 [Amnibacterium sp.]
MSAAWDRDRIGRQVGCAFGLAGGLVLLVLVNVWPGWWAVPVLTRDFASVLALVNVSLVFGAIGNLVLVVVDRRPLSVVFDLVSVAITIAVASALNRVFPFDFGVFPPGEPIARLVLVVVSVGASIGFVVQLVRLVATLAGSGRGRGLSA